MRGEIDIEQATNNKRQNTAIPESDFSTDADIIHELGPLIVSGQGKESKRPAQFYMILLALAVVPIGTGYFLASQFGYQRAGFDGLLGVQGFIRTNFYYVFISVGVFLAVVLVFLSFVAAKQLSRTAIYVHEKGIAGMMIGRKIALFFAGLDLYVFDYSQVEKVYDEHTPGGNRRVVIRFDGQTLYVYPANAGEIVEAITGRLNSMQIKHS